MMPPGVKFFNILAVDESGLVHANASFINKKMTGALIEDLLGNMSYQDFRLNIQVACTAVTK